MRMMGREESPMSEDEVYVNEQDGLSGNDMDEGARIREQLEELGVNLSQVESELGEISLSDLVNNDENSGLFPTSLIITGLLDEFFESDDYKQVLESIIRAIEDGAQFYYFKSFKRVRVSFKYPSSAIRCRIKTHLTTLGSSLLKSYFGQPLIKSKSKEGDDGLLHPPTPDKQFLISPPASPPVDWQPRLESEPNLDYDLIAALAKLGPGGCHELHRPESESHPSIVVHIADDDYGGVPKISITNSHESGGGANKFIPTRRPQF